MTNAIHTMLTRAGLTLAGVEKSHSHIRDPDTGAIHWLIPTGSDFGKVIALMMEGQTMSDYGISQCLLGTYPCYVLAKNNVEDPLWSGEELLKLVTEVFSAA